MTIGPVPDPAPPVEDVVQPGSLVDLIQQDLDELASNEETFIPFIGHERTGLAGKYLLPDSGKMLDDIQRKVERETKDKYLRGLNAAIDTMIALCDGLYVKPPGVDEYVMLDPQEHGIPVRFDGRMAEILGIDGSSPARSVVKKIFAGNEMAVMSHAEKLARWLNNTKADLTTELWQLGG